VKCFEPEHEWDIVYRDAPSVAEWRQ
jgi:hypothetical protein